MKNKSYSFSLYRKLYVLGGYSTYADEIKGWVCRLVTLADKGEEALKMGKRRITCGVS